MRASEVPKQSVETIVHTVQREASSCYLGSETACWK
jgi:hypothetical protein